MNVKLIARYIGVALMFNAMLMFVSLMVSLFNGMDSSFAPLLISALVTAMVGIFPLVFVRNQDNLTIKDGFAITIFAWILSCTFGMLPYLLWGGPFTLSNAWFESVSGYTTTGATILQDVESLPKGLLFWRTSTHFIGGMGVLVFMLLVLPTMSTFRLRISKIEMSNLSKDNYRYRFSKAVKISGVTYLSMVAILVLLLRLAGMNTFDSVNHAMSVVSTGGFSTRNMSILYYDSPLIEVICTVFMYLASLHFGLVYALFVNRSTQLLKSPVFRYFICFSIFFSLFIGFDLKIHGGAGSYMEAFRLSFFHFASVVSSTGLATTDTSVWPVSSIMVLMLAMYHGACSGSTCGAIKADRVWIVFKVFKNQIVRQLHPNAVLPVKVKNHTVDSAMVSSSVLYIVLYTTVFIIGTLLLSLTGLDFMDVVSSSLTAIGNVGPGFGTSGSLGNYDHFPVFAKFVMSIQMLLGRLEIYTLLMLFYIFRKK